MPCNISSWNFSISMNVCVLRCNEAENVLAPYVQFCGRCFPCYYNLLSGCQLPQSVIRRINYIRALSEHDIIMLLLTVVSACSTCIIQSAQPEMIGGSQAKCACSSTRRDQVTGSKMLRILIKGKNYFIDRILSLKLKYWEIFFHYALIIAWNILGILNCFVYLFSCSLYFLLHTRLWYWILLARCLNFSFKPQYARCRIVHLLSRTYFHFQCVEFSAKRHTFTSCMSVWRWIKIIYALICICIHVHASKCWLCVHNNCHVPMLFAQVQICCCFVVNMLSIVWLLHLLRRSI